MTDTEGEGKPGDNGGVTNLMVRNLAKSVTDEDLHAFFGGIGPIRSCFVVKDPTSGKSKRFGFVRFALLSHAQCAVESLHHSMLAGRRVEVQPALDRVHGKDGVAEQSDEKSAKKGKKRKHPNSSDETKNAVENVDTGHDGNGNNIQTKSTLEPSPAKLRNKRASGDDGDKKGFKNRNPGTNNVLKTGSVPMRTVVLRKRDGSGITEDAARNAFSCVPDAKSAIEDIVLVHDGKMARVIFKKWTTAGKAVVKVHGEELDACIDALGTGERTTAIVRNLPFRISRKMLEDAFASAACVRSVRLGPPPRSRQTSNSKSSVDVKNDTIVDCGGYAFVEFFTVSDAKHAIGKINGTEIGGRTVAVDMALSKSNYDHEQSVQKTEPSSGGVGQNERNMDGGSDNVEDKDDSGNSNGGMEQENDDKDVGEERSKKEARSSTEELARTVFVRNLLFETKAHIIWQVMEGQFGAVEQAVVVKSNVTKMSTGKAFVRFAREEDANAAVRAANGDEERRPERTKFNEKRRKIQSVNSSGLWIDGRRVFVSKAMERAQAKAAHADRFKEKDPRNLHLASVGSVARDSEEGKGLREEDWAMRDAAERNKRFKLKKNPNTFVSDVRLCVLNLPRGMEEKVLKAMFMEAAISGNNDSPDGKNARGATPKQTGNAVRITHCSIVRDGKRKNRSKGFGFVTFEKHEHALRALKAVNNNVKALEKFVLEKAGKRVVSNEDAADELRQSWGANRRLLVEFAVEDARQVQVLEAIKEKGRKLREQHRAEKESGGKDVATNAASQVGAKQNDVPKRNGKRKRNVPSSEKGNGKTRSGKRARHQNH